MSEKECNKAGLHKEISSIFKGVPIPQNDGGQEPCGTPASERTDYSEPKPPATEPQKPEAPEPDQFTQSLSKATSAQQPEADIDDKEIPSIFKGVPIPQNDGGQEPCGTPASERTDYSEPKPTATEPQKPEAPKPDQVTQSLPEAAPEYTGYSEPKPPATEPQKSDAPEADQVTQSLPEATPEHTDYSEPNPPATEPQKSEAPEADQFTQSLSRSTSKSTSKSTSAQQPKADIDDTERDISGSKRVPLWQTDAAEQPCDTPVQERTGYTEPKPQKPEAPEPCQFTQSLPKAAPEHTDNTEPKPPATDSQKPEVPKAYQATQSLPKSISAQQPKADIDDTGKKVSRKSTIATVSSPSFLERIKNKLFTPEAGVSDTKQKTMAVMMPVLFIILLVFVFKGGIFGAKVPKTEASGQDTASSVATADSNTDPMRLGPVENARTETETRTLVRLTVQGILYSEDKASAVIGNQIVHEGERIRGMTIIRISKDTVEFEMNGKKWTQKVRQ